MKKRALFPPYLATMLFRVRASICHITPLSEVFIECARRVEVEHGFMERKDIISILLDIPVS